ncbi:MAG: glycosyltransferase family 39 protein [Acidimicrobiia bacterium]
MTTSTGITSAATDVDSISIEADAPVVERSSMRWWLVAFVLVAIAVRIPAFFVSEFNSDETFIATQANVVLDGGQLYQQAADRKPPIVPYLYATTFALTGSRELAPVRMLAALCVGLTAVVLALEARRRWSTRAGVIAGALFTLASVAFAPQDGQAANFEVFMLLPMTLGVVLAARRKFASAGVAVAVATLTKQTGAATLLPVLFDARRNRGERSIMRVLLGFALPLLIAAAFFGVSDFVYWMLLGNGSYLSLGQSIWYAIAMFVVMTAAFAALNLPITVPLWRAWKTRLAADADLWWWAASALVSILVGLRFFGHYYLQLLPPLALLAGSALAHMSRRVVIGAIALSATVAVTCTTLAFVAKPFNEPVTYARAARYIEAKTGPNDRVLVWGAMPEIYWASGRLPATRILNTHFLDNVWAASRAPGDTSAPPPSPQTWTLFLDDLRERPPRYIVDTSTNGAREAAVSPISKYPEFARVVAKQYRYETTVDGITFYVRK